MVPLLTLVFRAPEISVPNLARVVMKSKRFSAIQSGSSIVIDESVPDIKRFSRAGKIDFASRQDTLGPSVIAHYAAKAIIIGQCV